MTQPLNFHLTTRFLFRFRALLGLDEQPRFNLSLLSGSFQFGATTRELSRHLHQGFLFHAETGFLGAMTLVSFLARPFFFSATFRLLGKSNATSFFGTSFFRLALRFFFCLTLRVLLSSDKRLYFGPHASFLGGAGLGGFLSLPAALFFSAMTHFFFNSAAHVGFFPKASFFSGARLCLFFCSQACFL